jgi:hypothetical protein
MFPPAVQAEFYSTLKIGPDRPVPTTLHQFTSPTNRLPQSTYSILSHLRRSWYSKKCSDLEETYLLACQMQLLSYSLRTEILSDTERCCNGTFAVCLTVDFPFLCAASLDVLVLL